MQDTTSRPPSGGETSAKRIVMIDDQPGYTEGLAMACDIKGGLEIVGRETSALDGVDSALDLQPDLVLCDYRMPGDSNGIDCATRLRDNGFGGEIVILTGYAAPHVHSEAALLDNVRVISKDLPLFDIIESVSALSSVSASASPATVSDFNLDEYILEEMALAESSSGKDTPNRKRKIIVATAATAAAITAGFLLLGGSAQPAKAADIGLERPFVMVDGTAGEVRVTVEVDGTPTDSFTPANLPITVAVDAVTPNANVQVVVENLDGSGTASCSIGVAKKVLVSDTALTQANAVCATTIN